MYTGSIYKVHPSGTALLYCSVNEHYWTGTSPLAFALVWLKDTESCLRSKSSRTQQLSSYNPYIETTLTGLENLVCVHAQAVLYEIPVEVSIRVHRE